jgi:hypothetical protein
MLTRIRRRLPGRGNGPWIVVAAVLVALLVTPFALAAGENRPMRGGARNPSPNASLSYTRETQIIANNNTYGTRQSNKSTRGSNLAAGRAFEFDTNSGTEVGRIQSGNPNAAPFTTNATGVATGLNADRVDGKNATEIRDEAVATATAQNRFAVVTAAGSLTAARGATTASTDPAGAGTFTVVFTDDLSKCAIAGTESTITDAGAVSVALSADNKTVQVLTRDAAGAAADRPFHLTVTC